LPLSAYYPEDWPGCFHRCSGWSEDAYVGRATLALLRYGMEW